MWIRCLRERVILQHNRNRDFTKLFAHAWQLYCRDSAPLQVYKGHESAGFGVAWQDHKVKKTVDLDVVNLFFLRSALTYENMESLIFDVSELL